VIAGSVLRAEITEAKGPVVLVGHSGTDAKVTKARGRAGSSSRTETLPTSHVAMLAKPKEVADVIVAAANHIK
jgi:hypothetical protein